VEEDVLDDDVAVDVDAEVDVDEGWADDISTNTADD
jgi:hypothetical protein